MTSHLFRLGLLVATAAAVGTSLPVQGTPRAQAGPRAALKRVQEIRQLDVLPPAENEMQNAFQKPGLVLTFDVVTLDGRQLLGVAEPSSLTAVDATGADLTNVEPNFFGDKQHVELVQAWDAPPPGFTLQLDLAARSAATFDLTATLDVTTYTGTEEIVAPITKDWSPLAGVTVGGTPVQARIAVMGGESTIEMKPGTVTEMIEGLALVGAGEHESNSSMWNDEQVTYFFSTPYNKAFKARLLVRRGLETSPLEIALERQPLP